MLGLYGFGIAFPEMIKGSNEEEDEKFVGVPVYASHQKNVMKNDLIPYLE